MTFEWLLAVAGFAIASCWTPGPNNTFLMASGLNFGFRRTLPPAMGVAFGFSFMLLAVAFGISALFQAVPEIYEVLKVASVAYLLWLAWRIATATPGGEAGTEARPLTFFEAAGFQWVNPKAWVMAVSASAAYVLDGEPTLSVVVMTAVFLLSGLGSSTTWALGGTALRRLIQNTAAVRAINIALALLLVASLIPIIAEWM